MKFSQNDIENWWFWKISFFLSRPFWHIFFNFFFWFIPMKTSPSLLISKDGSKFWSSQPWQHVLTQTKHFYRKCIYEKQKQMCQKWDLNPRPHSRTKCSLYWSISLESGTLDRSAILTCLHRVQFQLKQFSVHIIKSLVQLPTNPKSCFLCCKCLFLDTK